MAKKIQFDVEAREGIKTWCRCFSKRSKSNFRSKRKKCYNRKIICTTQITKDGVTVAKEIELEDALENMGAQMVKEVASKTND